MIDGATLSYVHPDHLDRPVAMTTSGGPAVAWSAKYDPFGNVVTITSPTAMPLRFPGQVFQIEDGLSYNWHRNYDPTLGRYSQADPLGFVDGPGVYNYVASSPLMGADADGRHKGDRWYGYDDRDFQRWFHKCWKQPGNPDADKEEIEEAYEEWKRRGSPPDGKCDGVPLPLKQCDSCEKVGQVVMVGGTAYLAWRCLRMLPSLLPAFWPTIPANVVVP
jgi:RHS repeat-associated protein